MKNIFYKITLATLVAGAVLAATSCSDELDLTPSDYYTPQNFWKDKSQFEGFITAQANMFRANYTQQVLFEAGDIRSGVLWSGTLPDGSGGANSTYIMNSYSDAHTQFTNFGGWFGYIANINEFIYRIDNQEGILTTDEANGLLAMSYGQRAYCYFQMYRMYGGVPLRTEPDVILGEYTPSKLYKPRATAEETLTQIKSDIDKSLTLFNSSSYQFSSKNYYWSKAATELLAGQVYLWSGKVSTGDHQANDGDVATAKTYFSNVINNYNYRLEDDYFNIWLTPQSNEAIFSVCYSSNSDGNYYNGLTNFNWAYLTGRAIGSYWSDLGPQGYDKITDGSAQRFCQYTTNPNIAGGRNELGESLSLGVQRYMCKNALFFQFNEKDQRSDAFYPVYDVKDNEQNIYKLDNCDPSQYKLAGTFVIKFRYSHVDGQQYWQGVVDMPIYRLPDAILGLAECYNYEGNNNGVKSCINQLRERAYGSDWNEATYGYTPGSFRQNESEIMREYDREFYLEGRRWWNLRRLTTVKGGSQTDHFVFQPEGCVGFGLPVGSSPWMIENDGTVCETIETVLPTSMEYRLLWPIDNELLGSDPEIKQNPGYGTPNN